MIRLGSRMRENDTMECQLLFQGLLAKGYTHKMIAKELNISPRTVETYLNHVKDKTNSNSKGDLVKYLLKMPV